MNVVSLEHIWGVIITTIVASIAKMVFNLIKEQKAKHEQEKKEKDDIIQVLIKNNQELIQWRKEVEADNIALRQELKILGEKIALLTNADLVVMKDKIIQSCKYFMGKGYIVLSSRENLTEMYNLYNTMGGNGSGKLMYEHVMKLPVKDISEISDLEGGSSHGHKRKSRKTEEQDN